MKALSLWQPWATLIATGAKLIETRSWRAKYRGPLAIHAAKRFPPQARASCYHDPFCSALAAAGYTEETLPLGAIVAMCALVDCRRIASIGDVPPEPERSFGDYAQGRYMWILRDVKALDEPVPAKGALGLREWSPTSSE